MAQKDHIIDEVTYRLRLDKESGATVLSPIIPQNQCVCDHPRAITHGSWRPPVYICGHCGRNLSYRMGATGPIYYQLLAGAFPPERRETGEVITSTAPLCIDGVPVPGIIPPKETP